MHDKSEMGEVQQDKLVVQHAGPTNSPPSPSSTTHQHLTQLVMLRRRCVAAPLPSGASVHRLPQPADQLQQPVTSTLHQLCRLRGAVARVVAAAASCGGTPQTFSSTTTAAAAAAQEGADRDMVQLGEDEQQLGPLP